MAIGDIDILKDEAQATRFSHAALIFSSHRRQTGSEYHKGIDLSGNAAAREDALALARDLKHGAVMPGWNWTGWSVPQHHERTFRGANAMSAAAMSRWPAGQARKRCIETIKGSQAAT